MLKKLLLLIIPFVAFVAGAFGGAILKPGSPDADTPAHESGHGEATAGESASGETHETASHGEAEHEAETRGEAEHDAASAQDHGEGGNSHGGGGKSGPAWFTFPSQFFVPLARAGDSDGLMILTLSLETTGAEMAALAAQEHRLRDVLLRQLLIAANTGGFDGNYTTEGRMRGLRKDLLKAVQASVGPLVSNVLIEDIARQSN